MPSAVDTTTTTTKTCVTLYLQETQHYMDTTENHNHSYSMAL